MSTLKFYVGSFIDDFTLKQFRTLTLQTRPVEVITISSMNSNSESMSILKNSPTPPAQTIISSSDVTSEDLLIEKLEKYLSADHAKWPNTLYNLIFENRDESANIALALGVTYLEKLFLA